MIPIFLYFTYVESRVNSFVAGLVYAVTGTTDFLDGWIARKKGLVTVIGKFLDPLADKLIVMAALVMLVHLGRVAAWVVIVIMAREFMVTGLRTIAMSEGIVISAGQEGKHKTAFQVAAITFLMVHYTYPIVALVFSVWSAVVYFRDFVRAVYGPKPAAASTGAAAGAAPAPSTASPQRR